jgi:D-3-phosphoglycerate dehydrogenase
MTKLKVHITTLPFNKDNLAFLEKSFDVSINPLGRKIKNEEVYEQVNKADYIIAGTEKYDQELLSKLVNLKGISRVGIGIDNIDLDIAAKNNIKVFNTPEEPAKGVAELTIAFILNLLREISSHQLNLNQGNWERTLGKSLNEATISLIGGGRVAKNVSKFLLSAGVKKIKVFDVLDLSTDPDWKHESISICGFEECLSNSDIVSLHVPMNEENKNMISKKEFLVMSKNSYLINVSRGGLINEEDLYEALNSNLIKGAALDVFATEPYEGKLLECKNLIATPHVASSTEYVRDQMERKACENLINLLDE